MDPEMVRQQRQEEALSAEMETSGAAGASPQKAPEQSFRAPPAIAAFMTPLVANAFVAPIPMRKPASRLTSTQPPQDASQGGESSDSQSAPAAQVSSTSAATAPWSPFSGTIRLLEQTAAKLIKALS